MNMADKTALDYQQLQDIVNKFTTEADDLSALLTQTTSQVESLHGNGWIGRGSNQFYSDVEDKVLPSMNKLVGALRSSGDTINKIVTLYKGAEQTAVSPFKQLNKYPFNIKF
jgi:WXG100 family type VII secretion target